MDKPPQTPSYRVEPEKDEITGLPLLSTVFEIIQTELDENEEVGFLYFDIIQFRELEDKYGYEKCQELLGLVGKTLLSQKGRLYRHEDLFVHGGKGIDYFILFLFSPPRRKDRFANHDLKLISTRIQQKLYDVVNENHDILEIDEEIDFHTGYTVIKKDPHMKVERLIYEARKEAGFKSQLEEIMIQFISNVSHELRTPLTSIKGYAETLLEGAMNDKKLCSRWLSIINDEAQRLERLINDLLDLSMLEAEQAEMHFKELDIQPVIKQVISILHPVAQKSNVKVTFRKVKNIPLLMFDEDRIKQVLLNLIHNAIKYSPEDEKVTIRVRKLKREVEIGISDKGCGIPKNHQKRIFERFYRIEKSTKGKKTGRGLGLAIAQQIVETHGGTIGVRSNKGEGSTFYIKLPTDMIIPVGNAEVI